MDVFRGIPEPDVAIAATAHALYAESDIVSLHLPLLDSTRGLVDERALGLMKPTAILINTGQLLAILGSLGML